MAVKIGGVTVTVRDRTLVIEDRIEARSTASFEVLDEDGNDAWEEGKPVEITDKTAAKIFVGFIDSIAETRFTPDGALVHLIDCKDNHYLADKLAVNKRYDSQAAGTIVNDIITNYLAAEGISAGTVSTGPTVNRAAWPYVRVSDALDQLAEAAGFTWYIDVDRQLHFRSRTTEAAAWTATADDMLEGTVSVARRNLRYRNRQIVTGGFAETASLIEIQFGDSQKRAFVMPYELAKAPTIDTRVGGGSWTAATVGINGLETGKDFYWNKGSSVVTQDAAATPLSTQHEIRVTFVGQYPVTIISEDTAAVEATKTIEGVGTGRVEDVHHEPQSTGQAQASQIAGAKLSRFADRGRSLRFDTRRDGLRTGKLLTVDLAVHDFAPPNDKVLIEAITIRDEGFADGTLRYSIVGAEGQLAGDWTDYFAAQERRDRFQDQINIGEDVIIAIFQQFSETLTLSESVTVTVNACPFPDSTTYPETTLYPC